MQGFEKHTEIALVRHLREKQRGWENKEASSQHSTAGMVLSWRYSVDNHSTHRNQNDLVRLHWLCTKANIVYNSLLCYFRSTSLLTLLHFPFLLYRSCHSEDWKGLGQLTSSLGTASVTTI